MVGSTLAAMLLLAVPTASLLTKPFTGCKKVSLLHRSDPADSETIEGDDCGNVKQIIGKWAKSKKVGELNGKAQAAAMAGHNAFPIIADQVLAARTLGEKVGLNGEVSSGLKSAADAAMDAADNMATDASNLHGTSKAFKGKFGGFASAISDDDIIKIKEETEKMNTAVQDTMDLADRATQKADEAKEAAMKSSKGALVLIKGLLADSSKLSTQVGEVSQKAKHAAADVTALIAKSKAAATKLDTKIGDAKEQAPVWEASKSDLEGLEAAADESVKDVDAAIAALEAANTNVEAKAKVLQDVADKAQSDSNSLLGQTENIGSSEESIRKTESELIALKGKVATLMKDSSRLENKIKTTNAKLSK